MCVLANLSKKEGLPQEQGARGLVFMSLEDGAQAIAILQMVTGEQNVFHAQVSMPIMCQKTAIN